MTDEKKTGAESAQTAQNKKRADFLIALKEKAGNISKACEAVNVGRRTYYDWMENDPEFAKVVEDINESIIDWSEDALKLRIQAGDTTAVIFHLKTKGKKRGYIEKQQFEHSGNVDHRLSITDMKESIKDYDGNTNGGK
jgi:hypothetical protein